MRKNSTGKHSGGTELTTSPSTFLHGQLPRYKVTGSAVTIPAGQYENSVLYRGEVLPATVPAPHLEHLLQAGLIASCQGVIQ